jgi:AraC family transcriptional regulator
MNYLPNVLRAVDYMERNLSESISVADVASEAAYSTFHFVRLFRALTGETPGSYLRKRRLTEAARELMSGRRRIIDIAFSYQFQSQESFTRSFKDCFGINPGALRERGDSWLAGATKRMDESYLMFCTEVVTMEPRIVTRKSIKLIGIVYFGDNKNWEIPKLWEEFMPFMEKIPNALPERSAYGLCFYNENYSKTGQFYYLAGRPVSSLEDIPVELVGKTLPACEYAVFTHKGPLVGESNTIMDTYGYAYGTWLPNSDYENPYSFDYEYYDERFSGNDSPKSEVDVYIPIRKK